MFLHSKKVSVSETVWIQRIEYIKILMVLLCESKQLKLNQLNVKV